MKDSRRNFIRSTLRSKFLRFLATPARHSVYRADTFVLQNYNPFGLANLENTRHEKYPLFVYFTKWFVDLFGDIASF